MELESALEAREPDVRARVCARRRSVVMDVDSREFVDSRILAASQLIIGVEIGLWSNQDPASFRSFSQYAVRTSSSIS
jgi:hypothetical protein